MPVDVDLPIKTLDDQINEEKTQVPGRLINNITFFGDSAIPEGDPIFNSVRDTAKLLAENNYTIVDGGGPGIMQAATEGAKLANGKSIAIYWEPRLASHFEGRNTANLTDESETYSNYMMRTLGIIEKGDVFVVCKGGTGTISEFGMVWCLAKLYYGSHKPVILFGEFWDDLIAALKKGMYLDDVELSVLYRANNPNEVLNIIQESEAMYGKLDLKSRDGDEAGFIINPKIRKTAEVYKRIASAYYSTNMGRNVAQEQLEEFMGMIDTPAQILDIGCGPGTDTKYLLKKYSVTGIEMVKKFADIAAFENPKARIINEDLVVYDLPKNFYNGIWTRDALHHLPEEELDLVFKKISDSLINAGILYMVVREGTGEIYEKERKRYSEIERFYHLFSEEELYDRAKRAGFKVLKIHHVQKAHSWIVAILKKI